MSLDAALARLMPADMAEQYRKDCASRDAKNVVLAEKVRSGSAEAIALLAEAIQRPSICRSMLKEALSKVLAAAAAAEILDPED